MGFHCIVNLFQIWSMLADYEELAVRFEPIKSGEIFVTGKDKTNTNYTLIVPMAFRCGQNYTDGKNMFKI